MGKKRRKMKKRRRHRSESSSESDSENSDMDLNKEMYPISHYVNDREEMINQVFSVIKGKKLRSMLPPFLADLDVDDDLSDENAFNSRKKTQGDAMAEEDSEEEDRD